MQNWKRNIALFLVSQTITLFGSNIVQYAIIWYVALETGSGLVTAGMTVCGFLPQVLISIFAGVWADRFNRKKLIILPDAGIALTTLILALIMINSRDYFWALYVTSAIRSLGAGIQSPSVSAAVTQLVPQEQLMRIGGINSTLQSIIGIASPIAAGAVLNWGPFYYVLFIDIVTAVIGIGLMLAFVPLGKVRRDEEGEKPGYFSDLKEGVSYVLGHSFLKRLLPVSAVFCLLIAPACFLNVLFVTRVFGESVWNLTMNELAFFIGAAVGGLVLSAWGGFKNRLKTLAYGGLVVGITTVAIGLVRPFWAYLVIIGIMGVAVPFNNSPLMVMIQEKVEPEKQGRVFSLLQIVTLLVMQAATMFFGPLADKISIRWIMIGTGIGLILMLPAVVCWRSFYREGLTLKAGGADSGPQADEAL